MIAKKYIFFRDDDVISFDDKFNGLFRLFLKKRVPVVYGVVPELASAKFLSFLKKQIRNKPGLFDVVQHGWSHADHHHSDSEVNYQFAPNRYRPGPRKYEFGPKRNIQEQRKDIVSGWVKLSAHMKDCFTPAFIPPFHAYDINTLKVINELGNKKNIHIFSAGKKTFPKKKNFLDLPAEMVFDPPLHNKAAYLDDFQEKVIKKLEDQPILGILLHHDTYGKEDLLTLSCLLAYLQDRNDYEFLLFSDMIKDVRRSRLSLVLETTNACNLKCGICDIWKERPVKYLKLDDIRRLIKDVCGNNALNAVSLTGGEPFLNPELDSIFDYLSGLKGRGLIDFIGIYTNGYAQSRIISFLEEHRHQLDEKTELGISLDGMSRTHNLLRGKPDAFYNTVGLIDKACKSFPLMKLAVKFTISEQNVRDIWNVYDFCRKRNIIFMPKLAEYGNKNYYHRASRSSFLNNAWFVGKKEVLLRELSRVNREEKKRKSRTVNRYVIDKIIEIVEHGSIEVKECYTPLYSLFISAHGDVHPCLSQPALMNFKRRNWHKNILNIEHFKMIHKALYGDCPGCMAYHGFLKNVSML